jgi:D-alanyl-D-alanine carboxypeptidase (penicillin-binding protein 5/6)
MKGPTSAIRFEEAKRLLDYGFSNFQYVENNKKNDTLKSISVDKGVNKNVDIIFEEDSGTLIPKSNKSSITSNINLPDKINAPIHAGQKIGEITYSLDGKTISTVNLLAKNEVKKLSFPNMLSYSIGKWINLLR